MAQGAADVVAGFFAGFPIAGGFARTVRHEKTIEIEDVDVYTLGKVGLSTRYEGKLGAVCLPLLRRPFFLTSSLCHAGGECGGGRAVADLVGGGGVPGGAGRQLPHHHLLLHPHVLPRRHRPGSDKCALQHEEASMWRDSLLHPKRDDRTMHTLQKENASRPPLLDP